MPHHHLIPPPAVSLNEPHASIRPAAYPSTSSGRGSACLSWRPRDLGTATRAEALTTEPFHRHKY